jgi:hypothetical protein
VSRSTVELFVFLTNANTYFRKGRGSEWYMMPIRSLASSLELFFLMRVEVLEGVEELRLWTGDIVIVIFGVSITRKQFLCCQFLEEGIYIRCETICDNLCYHS